LTSSAGAAALAVDAAPQIIDQNSGTALRQSQRMGAPQATAGACHEDHLFIKSYWRSHVW
jgi:hypothetical protein